MHKTTRIPLVIICFSIFLFCFFYAIKPSQEYKVNEAQSGAYEALTLFGLSRTYPSGQIPSESHYAEWEKWHEKRPNLKSNPDTRWLSIGPHNFAGRMLEIAFNPQNPRTIYAGSASGGLWRTTTGGRGTDAWHYVSMGFPVLGVSAIAFPDKDSMTIYVGTGEVYNSILAGSGAAYRSTRGSYGMGILKSSDGGRSWRKSLDWSYEQHRGIWDIKISPLNPKLIYTATTEGVYRSIDAGQSWAKVLNTAMANSLVIHPEDDQTVVVGCGNFRSPGFGIYKSTDGGDNWVKVTGGLPAEFSGKIQLDHHPNHKNLIYASIGNGFGFSDGATWTARSEDFGSTWDVVSTEDYSKWQGWFSHDIAVNPQDPNEVITGGISIWKSLNGGSFFEEITTNGAGHPYPEIGAPNGPPNYVHSDVHDVIYHPDLPDVLYVASDGGIHESPDGGTQFIARNGGLQTVQFYNGTSQSRKRSDRFIGGLQDNGSILYDGSKRWRRVAGGDGSWSAISDLNDDIFMVSSQGLNLRISKDGGDNFTRIAPPSTNENTAFIAPFAVANDNFSKIYAGRSRVYKSLDGGANWSATNQQLTLDGVNPILAMAVAPGNSEVVYAATAPTRIFGGSRGQVYVTSNGGEDWRQITGILPDRFPTDIAVDPFDPSTVYITFSGFRSGHVFKSTDFGGAWRDISRDLPDVPFNALALDPGYPRIIYAGSDLGVHVSEDGGQNWRPFQAGLFDAVMVFDLQISPVDRMIRLASHGNGGFERPMLDIPLQFDELTSMALQIFSNPTVGGPIEISYKVGVSGPVNLVLMDMTGRLIKRLVNANKEVGEHYVRSDIGDLPDGVYLMSLSSGNQIITEKILVHN